MPYRLKAAVLAIAWVSSPVFAAGPSTPAERAAVAEIAKSRSVAGVYYDKALAVQWTIGLHPDKSSRRFGFAHYVCDELRSRGLVNSDTIVRVVNAPAMSIAGKSPREASYGSVRCQDHSEMYP